MNIVIIANFTRILDGERENRFSYLADLFSKHGHNVELIISDFFHGLKTKRPLPQYEKYPFRITSCHEPGYKRNVSVRRLFSHYVWGHNVARYLSKIPTPDVVYCAIPSLTAAVKTARYCQKNNVKFVTDVQDLWPEAFYMAIHNDLLRRLFAPMTFWANQSYRFSDLAVAVSNTYVERTLAVNQKKAKGLSVFLGNNGELFDSGVGVYSAERQDDELLLCYVGTMSESYDIPAVISALKIVSDRNLSRRPIRFILVGDGPFAQSFKAFAEKVYPSCTFLGRRPYTEMAGLLASCDIAVNPIVRGSAASIINKVGDYALAGVPVINTQESPEYRSLIDMYKCGINCECGNPQSIADAISVLASDEQLRASMGKASRKLAEERFDRRNTYEEIVVAVEELIK